MIGRSIALALEEVTLKVAIVKDADEAVPLRRRETNTIDCRFDGSVTAFMTVPPECALRVFDRLAVIALTC